MPFQASFRHLTNVLLMNQLDLNNTINYYKRFVKNKSEIERIKIRSNCAKNWLLKYAPDEFKYTLNKEKPNIDVPENYKKAFNELVLLIKKNKFQEIELHNKFYELINKYKLDNKKFFEYAYQLLISKSKGPKLARFIIDLEDKAIKLLKF